MSHDHGPRLRTEGSLDFRRAADTIRKGLLVVLSGVLWLGCTRAESKSLALPIGGTPAASAPLPVDPALASGQLDNGVRYLLKPEPNQGGAVLLMLALQVGSAAEGEDERGFAHLIEHIAFDGAQRFGQVAPVEFLQRLGMSMGADINADTATSHTVYRLVVPQADRESIAQALGILRGFASQVQFDSSAVDRQRATVLAELRSQGNPGIGPAIWQEMFRGSLYAERAPEGLVTTLQGASPAGLEAFYRRWYRSPNLAVLALGQFERAELESLITQQFGSLPKDADAKVPPRFEVPLAPAQAWMLQNASDFGLTESSVVSLFQLPSDELTTEGDYRRQLADRCLSALLDARLEAAARQTPSPLIFPESRIQPSADGHFTALVVQTGAKPGQLRQAAEALLVELERVKQHGFGATEMASAQADLIHSLEQAKGPQSLQEDGASVATHFLAQDAILSAEQEKTLGLRLSAELSGPVLQARAAEWLNRSRRSVLVLRAPEDATLASEQALGALVHEVSGRGLEPFREGKSARELMTALPAPGKIVSIERLADLDLRIWNLANGAKVTFKPGRPGSGELFLRGVSAGGRSHSTEAGYWNARNAAVIVQDSGVGQLEPLALLRLLDAKRVRGRPWVSENYEGFQGTAPAADGELLFQLLHLYFSQPRRDPKAFEAYRARLRQPLEPAAAFARAIDEALYPGNLRHTIPSPAAVAALDLDGALSFYRDRFGNVGDFTFVIVADVAEDELKPLVERYLASLPGTPRQDRVAGPSDQRRAGITRVRLAGRPDTQSRVLIEFQNNADLSADARIDIEALAAYLRLVLRDVLREKLGRVYSVVLDTDWNSSGCSLRVSFDCQPEDVSQLQAATLDILSELRQGLLADGALEATKAQLTAHFDRAANSNAFWADELEQSFLYGTNPRDILTLPSLGARITAAQLASAARRYLPLDQYLDAVWAAR
jgi:zinc protease